MMLRPTALLGQMALAAVLSGCAGPRAAERPAAAGLPVPAVIGGAAAISPVPAPLPLDAVLRDLRLLRLIALALESNRDLRVAAANVEAARSGYGLARAERRLSLDATAAAAVGLVSTEVPDRYAVGLVPRFAFDLSGRLRRLSEAAFERYLSSQEARRGVRLALISAIATAYVDLATDRTLAALALDSQANGRRALEITKARLAGGIASEIDVRQAATILDQAEADEQNQHTLAAQDRNALELLVGAPVEDSLLPAGVEELEGRIAALPDGTSASVLLRRPDVAEAEALLRAADRTVGAARAAFYPTITLNGLLGTVSGGLFGLFGGNAGLDAGAQGLLPVLNGGGLRAGLDGARAGRDAERARLELTVQQAFREVADALARQRTIDAQVAAQARLVDDADAGVRLTRARYEAGEDDFLDTLVSERALYAARRSLAAARRLRAANRVALYVALGGDARSDDR